MPDLNTFANAAKGLAKNPLGIIALFIVLIYGFAALTLGFNTSLQAAERLPLIWFLVIFPVIVLFTFGWLVSHHHEKLYAPADYQSDESFLRGIESRTKHTKELQAQQIDLKTKVRAALEASPVGKTGKTILPDLLKRVNQEIDNATTITVDARDFLDDNTALFTFPVAAFETLGNLTDHIYFKIHSKVQPYGYGYSWFLRNKNTGEVVKNARMISRTRAGIPIKDTRTLAEVGISPGAVLTVESPK
jgi:hypothetical protein